MPRGAGLILRLPNGDSPFVGMNLFNDITHVWTYTPNCLNSLAAMHGFARTEFVDEGAAAIPDHRWLKVPLAERRHSPGPRAGRRHLGENPTFEPEPLGQTHQVMI